MMSIGVSVDLYGCVKAIISCFVLSLILLMPLSAWSGEKSGGIVVWRLDIQTGIDEQGIKAISGFLASEVEKHSGEKVLSENDIRAFLKGEEKKQQCGAGDTECVAEIGAALGVPLVVSGDLGKVGSYWILNLRCIKVHTAEVIEHSSRTVEGSINGVIQALPGAVAELFGIELPAENGEKASEEKQNEQSSGSLVVSSEPQGAELKLNGKTEGQTPFKKQLDTGNYNIELSLQGYQTTNENAEVNNKATTTMNVVLKKKYGMNPLKKWGYISFFSGLGFSAFGGVATWMAKDAANDVTANGEWESENKSKTWLGTAIAGYSIGGIAMITGIVLWAIAPSDEEWAKNNTVACGVSPDGQGGMFTVLGRW